MSGCCDDPRCRRKKPIMLTCSGLTGIWYAVTDYKDLGDGRLQTTTKHRLPPNTQKQLNDMRAAYQEHR